jgi:hypothetical protein
MDPTLETALITSSLYIGFNIIYKIINHYRLKSSCNSNNELVISVVDIEKSIEKPPDILNPVSK